MTLVEFLRDRLSDEVTAERERWVADASTAEERALGVAAFDRSLAAACLRFNVACRSLGWALLAAVWPQAARRRAAVYADHPDYVRVVG